jgi:DNA adenine methylase
MSDRREQAIADARRVLAASAGVRAESTGVEKTIWGSPAGKKRLADRLVAMLPAHKTYVSLPNIFHGDRGLKPRTG